jgi:hypothetical protein
LFIFWHACNQRCREENAFDVEIAANIAKSMIFEIEKMGIF